MQNQINSFSGDNRFMSNFWPVEINYAGITYPTVEHAYQAQKTTNVEIQKEIAALPKPSMAKNKGKELELLGQVDKTYWTQSFKLETMENLLRIKFSLTKKFQLAEMLINTGSNDLIEGNTWEDIFWGVCNNAGQNHLGKILMKIRNDLFIELNPRVSKLIEAAEIFLPTFIKLNENILNGRKGLVLAIFDKRQKLLSYPILTKVIGSLDKEKIEEKTNFAIDKVERVLAFDHFTSFQTEDEENKKFGGGLQTNKFFVSVSGFPPHLDQKFLCSLSYLVDDLEPYNFSQILTITQNNVRNWMQKNGEIL